MEHMARISRQKIQEQYSYRASCKSEIWNTAKIMR